ncbi:hypothetical protein [Novosphingobium sp. FKTRR1]|uniref:hypothetical protein n=1 Tax=Novosphingobium sp. FKTRR1 TaxID=2879118 RepID=UPI001CF01CCB|nr:hypothetical protein [Novosphingobium sp. FKTRR1]
MEIQEMIPMQSVVSIGQQAVPALVTLNLFQGPSGIRRGASNSRIGGDVGIMPHSSAQPAKWTLKQVQGDEGSSI